MKVKQLIDALRHYHGDRVVKVRIKNYPFVNGYDEEVDLEDVVGRLESLEEQEDELDLIIEAIPDF